MKLIDELNEIRHSESNIFALIIVNGTETFGTDLPFDDVPRKYLNRQVVGHDWNKSDSGVMILTLGKEIEENA